MVHHSESIREIKIRVFQWTQNMIKNRILVRHHLLGPSSRFGFLVLRVKNQMSIIKPSNCSPKNHGQTKKRTFKKSVQPFKICENSEEFVESIGFALGLSDLFFKETIPHLANTIYDYLSSSFGKNLNILSNMDDEFHKIIIPIDVDMESGRSEIESQGYNLYKFLLTDLYETLVNDGDNNEDKKGEFHLQVDGFQEYCVGVNKKSKIDVNMTMLANHGDCKDKEGEFYLQVEDGANKKRGIDVQKVPLFGVEYTFDDPDIQEIFNTLLDFLTNEREFLNKIEGFDRKIQKFREVKSCLKIVKLETKNVVSFELGDKCPVCFDIFEDKSVVVVTPCSHIFHRSCIFRWLLENSTCPICRESCSVLVI
ncbi:unnamed protein product [Withania somnifera]